MWGVIDHCVFHNMIRPYFAVDLRVGDIAIGGPNGEHAAEYDGAVAWTEPILPGSDHMMYVEDNTMTWDTVGGPTPGGAQCALYGQYGGRCCFRYNTTNGASALVDAHGDYPSHSTCFYEIYNNTFNYGTTLGWGNPVGLRGGQHFVYNNTFSGYTWSDAIGLLIYWYGPSPLPFDSIPHWINNTHVWGNTINGTSDQSAIVYLGNSGQGNAYIATLANIILNRRYFFHAPASGETYYPYTPLVHPHPLVSGSPTPTPTATPANGNTYSYADGQPQQLQLQPTPTATPKLRLRRRLRLQGIFRSRPLQALLRVRL